MTDTLELVSENKSFGGWLRRYRHRSEVLDCDMVFGIYLPPQAETQSIPLLWWLSGLTCTDENFMQKAGAHRVAAELGMAIICPDTSPRGTDLPGEHESYDFGSGAGFYVDATEAPWNQHYHMYSYVVDELPDLVHNAFPLSGQEAISGHSMGGHGALVCALHNPERYQSVSAFAPICHPVNCPWGEKAFGGYLGDDRDAWKVWDASELIRSHGTAHSVLVDQGNADNFLEAGQLQPEALEAACTEAGVDLNLRYQPGYDHSYFFIASFIEDHLRFHHARM
ncbi:MULTISPECIES: S-formylglutathione hydrolase [Halomonadaceae]|jgi:S-formylglutathione hydrolase|uniref:S-formylglutathione hydrolase n=1 Tax=Vreelandella halophila TaxID=86177 RepID=A0A9X4YEU9_9GAMM|nr:MULTISPECIES: S-formylglutathione hydrolase [Halomonas]MYL27825.1 S-formylglutathione hydrolase [Halomonas utahensis]MYL74951.1 S-formylglutathione hydrolase [Halomonas sp. 22501_18_FS]